MKFFRFLFALLGILLFNFGAFAQIVEQPDPLRPSTPDSTLTKKKADSLRAARPASVSAAAPVLPIFRYRFSADGTLTTGNVNRALLQLAGSLDYQLSNYFKLSANPSFVYGQQNKLLAEREWFTDFRMTYRHEQRLYYLAFGSVERSNLRRINRRLSVAGGAGYKVVNRKRAYLSVTNVFLHESTDFAELSDVNIIRNSTRLFGEYTFGSDRWIVTHTALYQPAIGRYNLRWNATLSLQVKLSPATSLRSTLANAYESLVVPGRRNNDLRFTVGVVYERK